MSKFKLIHDSVNTLLRMLLLGILAVSSVIMAALLWYVLESYF